jgi:hypothetical protein
MRLVAQHMAHPLSPGVLHLRLAKQHLRQFRDVTGRMVEIDDPQPLQALTWDTRVVHLAQHVVEIRRLMMTRIGQVDQPR